MVWSGSRHLVGNGRVVQMTKRGQWDDWRKPVSLSRSKQPRNPYADRFNVMLVLIGCLAVVATFTNLLKLTEEGLSSATPVELASLFYTAGWGLPMLFGGLWLGHWWRRVSAMGILFSGLVLAGATAVGIAVSRVDKEWATMDWLPIFSGVIAAILLLWGVLAVRSQWRQQYAKSDEALLRSTIVLRLFSLTDAQTAPLLTASITGDAAALNQELVQLVDDPEVFARSCEERPAWGAIGAALDPGGEQPWPSSGVLHGAEDLCRGVPGYWVVHGEPSQVREVADYLQRLGSLEFSRAYASIYLEERSPQYGRDEESQAWAAIEELRMFYNRAAAAGNHVVMRIW